MSVMANVAGNAVNLLARGQLRNWEAMVDTVTAAIRQRPRTATVAPVRSMIEAGRSAKNSLGEALSILKQGTPIGGLDPLEVSRQPHPLRAWKDLLAGEAGNLPKVGGKVPFNQKWLAAVEASPMMWNATAMLRALSATDLPFRQAARARVVVQELKVLDLNQNARLRALERNRDRSPTEQKELEWLRDQGRIYTPSNAKLAATAPELFFDSITLERINEKAGQAVYLQKNPLSQAMSRMMSGTSEGAKFWASTIVPFVKTPSNVIGEWLSWTPPVAAVNLLARAPITRNGALARNAAGKLVLGSIMGTAAAWLYKNGLLSPTDIGPSVQAKERELSREVMPAGSINVTGLDRVLFKGEPGYWQPGDKVHSVARWGGILGTLALTVADTLRWQEKQPQLPGTAETVGLGAAQSALLATSYGVQQSFLKGVASMLQALQDPKKFDAWLTEYAGTVGSVAIPNSLGAMARPTRENKPEVRGDSLMQRLEGKLRDRLGAFGLDKNFPAKRDLWGRVIPETPAGQNPWVYQIFDLSKTQEVPRDPLLLHVYNLYRATGDLRTIPTPPDQSLSIGRQQYALTRAQQSDLAERVGGLRYRMGQHVVQLPAFLSATREQQVEILSRVWEYANRAGTFQYLMQHGRELEPKRQPAGFSVPK
jgi:hypothetical protein